MEGSRKESMATAIESSKVILVLFSDSYQKSVNCQLELKYAISCAKPIIFIIVEQNFEIANWIIEIIDLNYKFEVYSVQDLGTMSHKVPKLLRIAKAIRDVGAAQPNNKDAIENLIE